MKRFALALLFVVALSLAAAPPIDTEALLRDGNTAFRRGDFATAVELYERAGLRTTEPALVAFNLATAKYRQALTTAENRAKHLEETEQFFRCCLANDDPRRGLALHFLGACLLQQALDGDDGRAQQAVEILQDCLKEPGLEDASADDARHNLALAHLLLAQTPPPPPNTTRSPDKPPEDGGERTKPQPKDRPRTAEVRTKPEGDPTNGKTDQRSKPGEEKADAHRTGNDTRETKAGGDKARRDAEGNPIDPADVRYLQDAFERIHEEQQAYKRKKAVPPAPGIKDW